MTSAPASSTSHAPARTAPTRDEELALLERLLGGESRAWVDFEAAYGRLVGAAIARVVGRFGRRGCSEDAAEIRAAFGLELLANDGAKLRAFDPTRGGRLGSWICLLASHAAYDFLRKRRREPLVEGEVDPDRFVGTLPDPFVTCELGERARLVATLVRSFTAKDRQFLELYFADGLSLDEVASRMGISVNTVYSKKHKIQGRLEALLGEANLAA
jgi:RNA polymerase sigma-70 factor (ECF subfamily)